MYDSHTHHLHKESDLDYFDTLQDDIAQYSLLIITVGDMNSRKGDVKKKYEWM